MEIREPSKKELKIIRNALSYFGKENLLEEYSIFIKHGEKKEVFLITREAFELYSIIDAVHGGMKIGELTNRRLKLTLEGSFLLAGKKKRVFVSERGEMLFLYGRDVFAGSILKADSDVKENDVVFVVNRYGDVIGIGKSRYEGKVFMELPDDKVAVENLVDRGEYLRKERLYNAY